MNTVLNPPSTVVIDRDVIYACLASWSLLLVHCYMDVTNQNNAEAIVEELKQVIVFTRTSINITQITATYTALKILMKTKKEQLQITTGLI